MLIEGTPQWSALFDLHEQRLTAAKGWEALREAWLAVPGLLRPALTPKLGPLKDRAIEYDRSHRI